MKLVNCIAFASLSLALSACADVPEDVELDSTDATKELASHESAIISGTAASAQARSVQGALLAASGSGFAVFCGGVYLGTDPQGRPWAATAAHCVDGLTSARRFGFGGLNVNQYTTANTVGWSEVVQHPGWNSATIVNDIAVVRLSAVPPNATPVDLADADSDAAAGETVTISGYGFTQQPALWCLYFGFGCPPTTNTLLQASPSVLTTQACAQTFASVNDTQICVRDPAGTRGACNGDSGGPMFRADGTVVGVTSFGRGGCSPSTPQVYTRISTFRDWIAQTTGI